MTGTLSLVGAGLLAAQGYRHFHQPLTTPSVALVTRAVKPSVVFDLSGKPMATLGDGSPEAAVVERDLARVLAPEALREGGLRIYCTLDSDLQAAARDAARQGAAGTEELRFSLLAVESESGAIRAFSQTAAVAPETEAALRAEVSTQAAFVAGGVARTPYLIARVSGQTGDLLYRAEPAESALTSPEQAGKIVLRQQAELSPILAKAGWENPAAGEGVAPENEQVAAFIAGTSSLVCGVSVTPASAETILARGHGRGVALPVWLDFMRAVPEREYPSVAFQAPVETTTVEEIPMVRRAVAVVQPEVRRAIPVEQPTIAFGGTAPAEDENVPIRKALPVRDGELLAARQALQADDGVVSTGTGFMVYPKSRRPASSWER